MAWTLFGSKRTPSRNSEASGAPTPAEPKQNPVTASFFKGAFVLPNWLMLAAACVSLYFQLKGAGKDVAFGPRFFAAAVPLLLAATAANMAWGAWKDGEEKKPKGSRSD